MDLKRRIPLLRWSFLRMALGARNITTTGQIGDGREAAAVDYVLANTRRIRVLHANRARRPLRTLFSRIRIACLNYRARGCAVAQTSRSACTVTMV